MSTRRYLAAFAFGLTLATAALLTAGPLDPPPGAISSTFKTLSDVEPRVALSSATTPGDADSVFRITQPGSYYLTRNLRVDAGKSGIEIAASNVSIDLMGFSVEGISGSLTGIVTDGICNAITVRNGGVNGFNSGIDLSEGGPGAGAIVEAVHARQNADTGINAGAAAIVRACIADDNFAFGIKAGVASRIEHSTATNTFKMGIAVDTSSVVADCIASYNETGVNVAEGSRVERTAAENNSIGIAATGATLIDCTVRSNVDLGMTVTNCFVSDCVALQTGGPGISADQSRVHGCKASYSVIGIQVVAGCTITSNSLSSNFTGMSIEGDANHIESNNLSSCSLAVRATAPGNLFLRNTAAANAANWDIAAGNNGLFVNAVDAPGFAGSAGGSPLGSTDPSANFSY